MSTALHSPLGLGMVGAGRFATFVAGATSDLPDVAIRAVADPHVGAARALAGKHAAHATAEWTELLQDDSVDVVVVVTPPADHAQIAVAALEAGRHVFCEKPLALDARDADHVVQAVRRTGRTLVVDHVLRYNPILRALQRLQGGLLGPLQRFCLENDASDEDLDDTHWFWDDKRSGGIFVEHGVHFFDAATMLTGRPAMSVQAVAARRPHGPVDMVTATALHGADVLATHTHSFTHAHRCERQLMRLDHGPAEVRVEGWIPVRAVVDLWTDDSGVAIAESLSADTAELMWVDGHHLDDGAAIRVEIARDAAQSADARGRGAHLHIPHHVRIDLTLGGPPAKEYVYAQSVRAAMVDLATSVRTGSTPQCGAPEGAAAVRVAAAATRSAAGGCRIEIEGAP